MICCCGLQNSYTAWFSFTSNNRVVVKQTGVVSEFVQVSQLYFVKILEILLLFFCEKVILKRNYCHDERV